MRIRFDDDKRSLSWASVVSSIGTGYGGLFPRVTLYSVLVLRTYSVNQSMKAIVEIWRFQIAVTQNCDLIDALILLVLVRGSDVL